MVRPMIVRHLRRLWTSMVRQMMQQSRRVLGEDGSGAAGIGKVSGMIAEIGQLLLELGTLCCSLSERSSTTRD